MSARSCLHAASAAITTPSAGHGWVMVLAVCRKRSRQHVTCVCNLSQQPRKPQGSFSSNALLHNAPIAQDLTDNRQCEQTSKRTLAPHPHPYVGLAFELTGACPPADWHSEGKGRRPVATMIKPSWLPDACNQDANNCKYIVEAIVGVRVAPPWPAVPTSAQQLCLLQRASGEGC